MGVAYAFLKRDFSLAISYRFSFALQFLGIVFSIATFYFLSLLIGDSVAPELETYGGDYFSFVLVGLAFMGYMTLSLSGFAQSIREGQMMGTLEIMLLTPTSLSHILLSSVLWAYLFQTVRVVIYLAFGSLIFGASLGQANPLGVLVVVPLSVASFMGIGIMSAAFIVVLKKGDPVAWVVGSVSTLLAGVYYPISVLPDLLGSLARLFPLTYALDAMRLVTLQGASLQDVRGDLLALMAFTVFLTPLSILTFQQAVRRAKKEGSLAQY